jgi:endonuclease YncB( thermonuclease family)
VHPHDPGEADVSHEYRYLAEVIGVVDGDTIDVRIDLGFDIVRRERVRIDGINTPEIRTKDAEVKQRGVAAREFVVAWVAEHPRVRLTTVKDSDKYGRYLARVQGLDGSDLGQELLSAKHAVIYRRGPSSP